MNIKDVLCKYFVFDGELIKENQKKSKRKIYTDLEIIRWLLIFAEEHDQNWDKNFRIDSLKEWKVEEVLRMYEKKYDIKMDIVKNYILETYQPSDFHYFVRDFVKDIYNDIFRDFKNYDNLGLKIIKNIFKKYDIKLTDNNEFYHNNFNISFNNILKILVYHINFWNLICRNIEKISKREIEVMLKVMMIDNKVMLAKKGTTKETV